MINFDDSQNFMEQLKTTSAILFDLDGTLFDLHIAWSSIHKYILNHYSRTYHKDLPELHFFSQIFEYVEQFHGPDARMFYENYLKTQELIAIKENNFQPTWLTNHGLDYIASHIRFDTFFGIISSNYHETILEILTKYGLKDRFKVIIGRNDVKKVKPNPEGLIRVIDQFDLFIDKVIFIGNAEVDEEAAQRAQVTYYDVKDVHQFIKNEQNSA